MSTRPLVTGFREDEKAELASRELEKFESPLVEVRIPRGVA